MIISVVKNSKKRYCVSGCILFLSNGDVLVLRVSVVQATPTYCLLFWFMQTDFLLYWFVQAFEFELRREYTEHYLCKQVLHIIYYYVSSWSIFPFQSRYNNTLSVISLRIIVFIMCRSGHWKKRRVWRTWLFISGMEFPNHFHSFCRNCCTSDA